MRPENGIEGIGPEGARGGPGGAERNVAAVSGSDPEPGQDGTGSIRLHPLRASSRFAMASMCT